jgi:TP901 family phage tail tape measure protein
MSASGIRAGSAFVEIFLKDSKFQQGLTSVQAKMMAAGARMRQVGTQMAMGGAMIGAPMILALRNFAQFDDAIRATGAVSQATAPQLASLTAKARELGATTSFTAVQVANLMTELGRAGFKPDEIEAMTGAVMNLARATGTDATLSAGIMAATLRQFGLGAGDATRVSDVLTAAANKTFNTVEGLGEALKYAGITASQAGMSIEETAAVLGTLGNMGIQGSMAGTALRRLTTISGAAAAELQQIFGVSFLDAAGNVRPLIDSLEDVSTATENMSSGERIAKFNAAFGLLGITGAQAIGGTVAKTRELTAELYNAGGTAAKTAKDMDAGLGGAMRILWSAIEGISLAFGDALAPSLIKLAQVATSAADGIRNFIRDFPIVAQLAGAAAGGLFGLGVAAIIGGLALQTMARGIGVLKAVLTIIPTLCTPVGIAIMGIGAAVATAVVVARELSPAFKRETDAIASAIMALDFSSAWKIMNLNFAIALVEMGGYASEKLAQIQGFFAAAGALIGDTLTEGLDRFMGLFGADIITLQTGVEKLGLYMRAAFDWEFWATGLKGAIKEVEAEADRQRARAPTADARAKDRTNARQEAADGRQAAIDKDQAGWNGTADELRKELDAVHEGMKKQPAEPEAEKTATGQPRPRTEGAPGGALPGGAAAGSSDGIGRTLGTFGDAAGLAIGPELGNLNDSSRQTAENTARIADDLEGMAAGQENGLLGGAAARDAALGRGALPAGIDLQLGDGAVAGGAPPSMLAGTPAFRAASSEARKASAAVSAAADTTTTSVSVLAALRELVAAVNAHAGLTAAGNKTLGEISGKMERLGGAFL